MSWICVGCSERHPDGSDVLGFGLCKKCQDKSRKKKAVERAAMLTRKAKMYSKAGTAGKNKPIKVSKTRAVKVSKARAVKVSKTRAVKVSKTRAVRASKARSRTKKK